MTAIAELENQTKSKTPSVRVLDLLAGWIEYVDRQNGEYPDTLSYDDVADLYQTAGEVACRDFPDSETERDAVCRFLTEKVIPLVLK